MIERSRIVGVKTCMTTDSTNSTVDAHQNRVDEKRAKQIEREVYRLLVSLKSDICDDYRASDDPEDNTPGMQVTISSDDSLSSWSYQTGDNSYSGGCYGDPNWGVIYLYRRSNCRELAKDAVDQICEAILQ